MVLYRLVAVLIEVIKTTMKPTWTMTKARPISRKNIFFFFQISFDIAQNHFVPLIFLTSNLLDARSIQGIEIAAFSKKHVMLATAAAKKTPNAIINGKDCLILQISILLVSRLDPRMMATEKIRI